MWIKINNKIINLDHITSIDLLTGVKVIEIMHAHSLYPMRFEYSSNEIARSKFDELSKLIASIYNKGDVLTEFGEYC